MLPAAAAYDDYYLYEFARESERGRSASGIQFRLMEEVNSWGLCVRVYVRVRVSAKAFLLYRASG